MAQTTSKCHKIMLLAVFLKIKENGLKRWIWASARDSRTEVEGEECFLQATLPHLTKKSSNPVIVD